jgi:hypothetical protein
MAEKSERPELVDTAGLTDAEWAEISSCCVRSIRAAAKPFWDAMDQLGKADPVMQVRRLQD